MNKGSKTIKSAPSKEPDAFKESVKVHLQIVDYSKTQSFLNEIKNLFSREMYDDFINYAIDESIDIFCQKEDKKETVYVPEFCIFSTDKFEPRINSKNKGYAVTFGLIVGDYIKTKNAINCGIHIIFFKPFKEYPGDDILDEYNRVSKLIEASQESNYKNIRYDLPEPIM